MTNKKAGDPARVADSPLAHPPADSLPDGIPNGRRDDDTPSLYDEDNWADIMARDSSRNGHQPTAARSTAVQPIDWATFLYRDLGEIAWLPGRFMESGQQVALVGKGKAGKSLLMQDWARHASAGLPFLGDVAREPVRVLYADRENPDLDIQERMLSFGATPDQLRNVIYLRFPKWGALDTEIGGEELLSEVLEYGAQVVVLDTISRFVVGKENDSDTWLSLYRHTLARLKSRGVGCIRLDHFGKDVARGGRGSSAKEQDVDHVWELSERHGGHLLMQRTYTRSGHGDGSLVLRRFGAKGADDRWKAGTTRHALAADEDGAAVTATSVTHDVAARLDAAGVPRSWGRRRLHSECQRLGIKVGTETLVDVARVRKAAEDAGKPVPDTLQLYVSSEDQDR